MHITLSFSNFIATKKSVSFLTVSHTIPTKVIDALHWWKKHGMWVKRRFIFPAFLCAHKTYVYGMYSCLMKRLSLANTPDYRIFKATKMFRLSSQPKTLITFIGFPVERLRGFSANRWKRTPADVINLPLYFRMGFEVGTTVAIQNSSDNFCMNNRKYLPYHLQVKCKVTKKTSHGRATEVLRRFRNKELHVAWWKP